MNTQKIKDQFKALLEKRKGFTLNAFLRLYASLFAYFIIYFLVTGTFFFYLWLTPFFVLKIFFYVVLFYLFKIFYLPISYWWVNKYVTRSETLATIEVSRQFNYTAVIWGLGCLGALIQKDKALLDRSFASISFLFHLVIAIRLHKKLKKMNIDHNLIVGTAFIDEKQNK